METASLWKTTSPEVHFPRLDRDLETDVVIVGGGITGISAAHLLKRAAVRVVVLEAGEVGLGTTGFSTGNLHMTVDEGLYSIERKWGRETAARVVKSRAAMIDLIERNVAEFGIECGFYRRPHYLFSLEASRGTEMRRELRALHNAGLAAEAVDYVPLPFSARDAIRIDGQAQFHPLAYVRSLAAAVESEDCRIFEYSPVVEFEEKAAIATTARGKVRARKMIMATHTPKGFNILQTQLGPYREYGIAARLKEGPYPRGLFWSMEEPSRSIRSYKAPEGEYLVVIGEEHKVGQQDNTVDYFRKVEDFARARFSVEAVTHRWSAQNYKPADGLPYIGPSIGSDHLYVATGFAAAGLLYGVLAASIITDMILGRKNPWEDVFSSRRFTPLKSAGDFLAENVNVMKEYVRDYVFKSDFRRLEDIAPGSGGLVELESREYAISRDESGRLTALDPLCTHLGCMVHWNAMEGSWDCPCHGSRFRPDGGVIEGPADLPLGEKELPHAGK